MIGFCPLGSGSTGNSVYLGTENAKILIDCGISFKNIKERLADIQVGIDQIDAVLITHEHADHIKGLEMIVKKLGIPVFCNGDTAKALCQMIPERPKFKIFCTGEPFTYADIKIHPFSIQHDTVDPVAFTFEFSGMKIGVCTDLGFATKLVAMHLKECDYLYLEANHAEEMVHASSRPLLYKQRVLSRQGHLSNVAAGELLVEVYHDRLKHVYLAHLSSECNTEKEALTTVQGILAKSNLSVPLSVAKPHEVSQPILFSSVTNL